MSTYAPSSSLPERLQLGELREKMKYQLVTFLEDTNYNQVDGTIKAPFDIIKKRNIVTDELIRNMYNTVHSDDTTSDIITKKHENNAMIVVNAHIQELMNYLSKQGNSSFIGQPEILKNTTIPSIVKEYTDMMYPREADSIVIDYPKDASKNVTAKTVKESIDKVSRSVEKFLKDIDLPRARNMYEQKINQNAADEFKDEMSDFSMQNAELAVEEKRLQNALTTLLMNSSNPVQFKRTVDALLDALGTKPPMEIQYLKDQQGGTKSGKKTNKVIPLRKWMAMGGVDKDQVESIIKTIFADEVKQLVQQSAQQVAEKTSSQAKIPLTQDEQNKVVELQNFLKENTQPLKKLKETYDSLIRDLISMKETLKGEIKGRGAEILEEIDTSLQTIKDRMDGIFTKYKEAGSDTSVTPTYILNKMETDLATIKSNIEKLNGQISLSSNQFNEQVRDSDTIYNRIRELSSKVDEVRSSIETYKNRIIQELGTFVAGKKEEITNNINSAIGEVIEKKVSAIHKLSQRIDNDVEGEQKGLTQNVNVLESKVQELSSSIDTIINPAIITLLTKVSTEGDDSLVKKTASIREELDKLNEGLGPLSAQFSEATRESGTLAQEITEYKTDIASLKQILDNKHREVESALPVIDSDIEQIKNQVAEKHLAVKSALDALTTKITDTIKDANLESILTSAKVTPDAVMNKLGEQLTQIQRSIADGNPPTEGGAKFVESLRVYSSPIKEEELQQMMDDLRTKIPANVVYVQDILRELDTYAKTKDKQTLDKTIGRVVELYGSLSMYETQLANTSLTDVRKTIYGLIENEINTLSTMVEGGTTSSIAIQEFMEKNIKPNKDVQDKTLDDFIKNAESLFNDLQQFYKTKDDLFPVRIVLNYGKRNASKSVYDLVKDRNIENNYNKSKISNNRIQNILPVEKRKNMKDQYGPYYLVTDTSSTDYNVEEDIERMFDKNTADANTTIPHIIYSAYGFSGSGKSYTLIQSNNPNNVLTRVIKSLQRKKTALQSTNEGSDLYLKYRIYDYYGEYDDGKCVQLPPNKAIERIKYTISGGMKHLDKYSRIKTSYFESKEFRQVPLDEENTISNKIFEFEDIRKTNMIKNVNPRIKAEYDGSSTDYPKWTTEYHIRATPNNDQSSRSHLFVDIDIYQSNKTGEETQDIRLGRVSLMDMAGSEDVDAIQRMYFKDVDTNYEISNFTNSVNNIKKILSNFKDIYTTKLSQLKGAGNTVINNTINSIPSEFNPITKDTTGEASGSFIIEKSWLSLAYNLPGYSDNPDVKKDMVNFALNYNLYNYLLILEPYYILREAIRDILFNIDKNIDKKDNKPKPNDFFVEKEVKVKEYIIITINLTIINNILKQIGLSGIGYDESSSKNYFNYGEYVNSYYNKNSNNNLKNSFNNIAHGLNESLAQLFKNFNATVEKGHLSLARVYYNHLKAIPDDIQSIIDRNKISKDDIQSIIDRNKISNLEKLMTTYVTINGGKDTIKRDIKEWTVKYLYGVHCPIRYQGNFIMDTISSLETYLKNIQQNSMLEDAEKIDTTHFPGNKLHQDLKNVKPKFVLFTNVRLDFDPESDFVDNETNVANNNFREAYVNSITFSDRINPLAQDVSTFGSLSSPSTLPTSVGGSKDKLLRYKGGEEFIQRVMDGGAKKDEKEEPVNTSDPQAVIEASKAKLGDLSEIKRDLNASITAFQNIMKKVNQFNDFKKILDNFKGATDSTTENEIIGAYNYLKEEGVTIKEEFKATIDDQRKKIKNIQNRISKIIQTELPAPPMVKLMALLVTTLEERIDGSKKKQNNGVYNEISSFYADFEQAFSAAYSKAKSQASAIQEQRQLNARIQASIPLGNVPFGRMVDNYGRPIEPYPGYNRVQQLPPPQVQAPPPAQPNQLSDGAPSAPSAPPAPPATSASLSLAVNEEKEKSKNIEQEGGINVDVIIEGLNTILERVVGDLIRFYSRRVNPAMSIFTADSLFNRILNDYINNRTETNEAEVRERFMNALEHNNLVPRKVLAITRMDKIIFIFITLFIRLISTAIITSLVERGVIKDMTWAVTGYLILYTLVMLGFVMIVNLDMYRMRIVFNYVNFHANSGKLYMHIILLYILAILIYIVMTRINQNKNITTKAISDNDKLRLIMRFQILTGILWAVLALVIAIGTE